VICEDDVLVFVTGTQAQPNRILLCLVASERIDQVAADWRIFIELGHVHAAHDGSGRIVATAATLPYGRFGWISMVLVTSEYRRQGLATRLMHRCIEDLTSAGRVPVLDATPAGREVYRALGFEDTWSFHRLTLNEPHKSAQSAWSTVESARNADDTEIVIRAIADHDWPAICTYDAAAFGANRGALIAHLRARLPQAALVAFRGDRIAGFSLGRDGRTATQLGPLIAKDGAVARALLARALEIVAGPIYVDLADSKVDVGAWLAARGFAPQRPLTHV